jgi:fatty acid synthase subunit alpha, fungi type
LLESAELLANLSELQGLVNLEKIIIITRYAEVGPWRSLRTKWEMVALGELRIQRWIEMAWMMGYIKHVDGCLECALQPIH